MVNYCSVYKCTNNSIKNRKLSFFLLPEDPSRLMIWLPRMGRQEWMTKTPEQLHKKRICSDHFTRKMSKLTKDAYPNLFREGVGQNGVNKDASTPVSTSMDIENNNNVEECSGELKKIEASMDVENEENVKECSEKLVKIEASMDGENKENFIECSEKLVKIEAPMDDENKGYVEESMMMEVSMDVENKENVEEYSEESVKIEASTFASPSMDLELKENVKKESEESINFNIKCTTPDRMSQGTQTSPEREISDEEFVQFCRRNFNSTVATFMIVQLKLGERKPKR